MIQAAKIVARGDHRNYHCPTCGKLLGKVFGDVLTVKNGGGIVQFDFHAAHQLTCSQCSTTSTARYTTYETPSDILVS